MRTETKTVPSTSSIFNVQGCILTDFHICALYGYWLTWGTGEFLSGKAKRCFRDWPFVYFHLSGDSANFNMWKSDYKNKRYQETGMEYLTKVQMIVKDEGYKYFAGRATFEGVTTSRATSGERRKERNTSGQRGNKYNTSCRDISVVVAENNGVVKPKC